ncbi:hypothetical protein ACFYMB_25940 [Micromonospora haikouensis]|uniref:hypothetical protein n=1 Tax=Micromonospora haikouensis TaxID=686309 RepID=UPI0036868199
MRRRLLTAFVVLAVAAVVPPPASARTRPATAPGPHHEPIEVVATIPFPGGVVPQDPKTGGTNFSADLAPDGRHIVTTFAPTEGEKQVGVMDLDGTDFRCITCGRMKSAWGPDVFPDQRRMLVQVPSPVDRVTEALPDGLNPLSAGTGDQSYAIVECLPSIYDCRTLRRQPLEFPRNSLLEGAQNRTVSVSPDGRYVKWAEIRTLQGSVMVIGRLHSDGRKYTVRDPLVLNPPYRLDSDVAAWSDGSRYYETGAFADGGRTLKYGTEGTALNYDIYELDLATGRRTRVTTDLDYNELYAASPDGTSLAYSSGRGLDRMTVFSQVTRPPLIDLMSFSQLGRIALWNNRLCMNEMWLMPRGTQSGTYGGQPVVPEDNWHIRGWSWFADGTKALVTEFRDPAEAAPGNPAERVRLQILSFPNRKPTAPEPVVDLDTVDMASWAIPYDRYVGMGAHAVTDRTIKGKAAGTARVRYLGTFAAGSWTVDYDHYSEDGVTFLDGSESMATPSPVLLGVYQADLSLTGSRRGYLRADLTVLGQDRYRGSIVSEVDGRRLSGVPTQATCPGVHQPGLRLTGTATAVTAGTARIRATVDSRVPADATYRPVAGATVEAGGVTATTGADGTVSFDVPAASGDVLSVRADAGGFRPADVRLTAG